MRQKIRKLKFKKGGGEIWILFFGFIILLYYMFIAFSGDEDILLQSIKNALNGSANTLNNFINQMIELYFS